MSNSSTVLGKLVARAWATLVAAPRIKLRDLDGQPVTRRVAKQQAAAFAVPDDVRRGTTGTASRARTHRIVLSADASEDEGRTWRKDLDLMFDRRQ